jgi:hypothetical protein
MTVAVFMSAWEGSLRSLLLGVGLVAVLLSLFAAAAPSPNRTDGLGTASTFARAIVRGDASAAVAVADPREAAFWKEHLDFPITWCRDNDAAIESILGTASEGFVVVIRGTSEGIPTEAEISILVGGSDGETRVTQWSFSVITVQPEPSQVAL